MYTVKIKMSKFLYLILYIRFLKKIKDHTDDVKLSKKYDSLGVKGLICKKYVGV